jgi:hypothetical protein
MPGRNVSGSCDIDASAPRLTQARGLSPRMALAMDDFPERGAPFRITICPDVPRI